MDFRDDVLALADEGYHSARPFLIAAIRMKALGVTERALAYQIDLGARQPGVQELAAVFGCEVEQNWPGSPKLPCDIISNQVATPADPRPNSRADR
jgi:hypothetical protein